VREQYETSKRLDLVPRNFHKSINNRELLAERTALEWTPQNINNNGDCKLIPQSRRKVGYVCSFQKIGYALIYFLSNLIAKLGQQAGSLT